MTEPATSADRGIPTTDHSSASGAGSSDRAAGGQVSFSAALVSPWAPRLLTGAWLALLVAATQLPQDLAPLQTTDGLSNPDLGAIAALGLARISDSLLLWLLSAATVTVAVARTLFEAPALVSIVIPAATAQADLAARIERSIGSVIEASPWRRFSGVRAKLNGNVRRIEAGLRGPGHALLAVGAIGLVAVVAWTGRAPASVVIDVPVGAKIEAAVVPAYRGDRGRWEKATGHFEAGCTLAQQTLSCVVEGFGERGNVTLKPGGAAALGDRRVAWVGTAIEPTARRFRFDWWRAQDASKAQGPGKWYAFDARDGRHATISALDTRLSTFATKRSGPVAIGVQGKGAGALGFVAAGPALIPSARPTVRSHAAPRVRLRLDPPFPTAALFGAVVALLIGALLVFGAPGIRVDIDATGSRVRILDSNRLALREGVVRACADSGEDRIA